jgi:hypothetical protein
MNRGRVIRFIQIAIVAITVAAVVQELSKPKELRRWHGTVFGFIPYDFRLPTFERLKESYWNPYEPHVLTPWVFGIGWAVNFYALFENLGLIHQTDYSEESFLMPNERMKQILKPQEDSVK